LPELASVHRDDRARCPWLWSAIVLWVLLQLAVVNLDVLNVAFGTAPLDLGQWSVCAAMASSVLWVGEVRTRSVDCSCLT